MPDRERGFIVVHRRVRSSAIFRSLTAEQRSVFLSLLLLANWKDRQMLVGGAWETIRRGELAHSLKTIARDADVSVKVVRTTLGKLFADDRPVGGKGPFLTERWIGSGREVGIGSGIAAGTVPGTAVGTPLRVLTIVNYDAYQSIADDAGTGAGTGVGHSDGHDKGTAGARQGHQENQGNQENQITSSRAARVGIGSPAFEAITHWRGSVWPRLSTEGCPEVTTKQAQSLAGLSGRHGPEAVKAAMDCAAADPFWGKQLDLDTFVARFAKFLGRKTPAAARGERGPVEIPDSYAGGLEGLKR